MTDLPLSHYSHATTITPHDTPQEPMGMKPRGLWVSVDGPDDWPTWCRAEHFRDIDKQNRFTVTLNPEPDILTLTGMPDLVQFTRRFKSQSGPSMGIPVIDWQAVATEYAGIIITPYCWPARMDPDLIWYYGWDCASGCIWDASTIHQVNRITHP